MLREVSLLCLSTHNQRQEPAPSRVMRAGGAGGVSGAGGLQSQPSSPEAWLLAGAPWLSRLWLHCPVSKHTLLPSGEGAGLKVSLGCRLQ